MKSVYDLFFESDNPIVEDVYCDLNDWYEKEQITEEKIIKELEWKIYQAIQDYDPDDGYTKTDIKNAKKLLAKMKVSY